MNLYIPNKPTIILLGDIMLDHNIEGNSTKIANESPIPVVHCKNDYYNIGGCGNVLLNMVALGAKDVYLFSKIGDDSNGKKVTSLLPNIINNMIIDPDYTTTTKNRIYSDNKLLCRYDNETIKYTTIEEENKIIEQIETILSSTLINSVVFSDYNKGFLTKSLCQKIINLCNRYNVYTIVDPKQDYTKYINCTVIKPNRSETKHIFNIDIDKGLIEGHQQLHKMIQCKTSVITLSGDGISAYDSNIHTCSTESKEVIDVTGAGDIVCSVLGVLYPYLDIDMVIKIANYVATISVSHIGVYTITEMDILHMYKYIHNTKKISLEYFPKSIPINIVFTNGCFDVLHAAHIELFKFCRNIGNIVVVGLNSDHSIKRLKGDKRPIYKLEDRIHMLEAIEYIDYIIPFEEDTPIELMKYIQPTIIVKGGDYTKDSIIGKEYAKEVIIFNYIEGKSTTNTIHKMNQI